MFFVDGGGGKRGAAIDGIGGRGVALNGIVNVLPWLQGEGVVVASTDLILNGCIFPRRVAVVLSAG